MTIQITFSKVSDNATMPTVAHEGDAGMDLASAEEGTIRPGDTLMVSTDLKVKLPPGTFGMICPRSGLAAKQHVTVLNAPGIVDSSYDGIVKVILHNAGHVPFNFAKGTRIAQMIVMSYGVTNLHTGKTENRGTGGFGSSGL